MKFCRNHSREFKIQRTLLVFLVLSFLTALVYFAGYLNMPTMILFGLIVAIYTFFQFIRDGLANNQDNSLLFTNLGIFSILVIFLVIFGVRKDGFTLQQYSAGHILAIMFIIGETLVMYGLLRYLNRNKGVYLLAVIAVTSASLLAVYAISSQTFYQLTTVFGQSEVISSITESQPWSLDLAFSTFNVMLILGIAGFAILVYQVYTKKRDEHLFFMIWSLIIFVLTVQHLRFEYYFAVNVTLLSSLCIVTGLTTGFAKLGDNITGSEQVVTKDHDKTHVPGKQTNKPVKPLKKLKESAKSKKMDNQRVLGAVIIAVILGATAISIGLSVQSDIDYSTSPLFLVSGNWLETTTWLETHTPDPGIGYLKVYQKEGFSYPGTAYGILSWWDYGHYITFIGKRIPVTNPFQDHLTGPDGAAAFYMSGSETNASGILQSMGAHYVITDTSLATDKFQPLTAWNDSGMDLVLYMKSFFAKNPAGKLMQLNGELPPYFHTTVVRLHNFDGSMQIPGTVTYMEYNNEDRNGFSYPMVTTATFLNVTEATNAITNFERQSQGNSQAIIVGQFLQPVEQVPALQHFRLVHESPGKSPDIVVYDNSGAENLNPVKVFEFVKGAHIRGEGMIELQVVTNTGRTFMYRQESSNGEFVVPYSTVNNPYDIKTVGNYHILGTNKAIDVSEEDVLQGRTVGG
jgi:dolichyl-diphosphooligosaccharide--protein glycosyltransferase